jgi:Dynein heavy chain, N-terminal region 2
MASDRPAEKGAAAILGPMGAALGNGSLRCEPTKTLTISGPDHPVVCLQTVVSEFNIKHDDWLFRPFALLDAEHVNVCVTTWLKSMTKLAHSLPREELRAIAGDLRTKLDDFQTFLPIISCVCNVGMRARHWLAVSELAGYKVSPSEDSLHHLVNSGNGNLRKLGKELQVGPD